MIHNYDLLNGFAATIEPSYLLQLQSSLTDRESAIEYIGEPRLPSPESPTAHHRTEPDSVVTIQ